MKSEPPRRLGRPPGIASAPDRRARINVKPAHTATEAEKIREYGIEAWHTTWADTPHEERVRQIQGAYAEVGEPVPEGALLGWEELADTEPGGEG